MDNVVVDYGVAHTVDLDIYITANPEAVAAAFTPAAGDTKISTNRGVTFTNTTNTCTFANGIISVVLTATEMQAARIILKFQDQDAALVNDAVYEIFTKNHASAFYTGIDLNTDASGNVTLAAATHTGAVIPTVSTLTGHTAQTGDTYALANGAAGFVAIDTVVDAIKVVTDAQTAISPADFISLIFNRSLAAHQTALSAGRAITLGGVPIAETTATGTPTTTAIQLTAGSAVDNFYIDQPLKILSGAGAGQVRIITSYTGATKTCNFDEAYTVAPSAADVVAVGIEHIHSVAQIVAGVVADAVIAELTAQGDTNETKLDTLTTQVGTAGAGLTDLGGMSTGMKAEVNAEVVDTLATDTYAEPGQGAPAATTSLAAKINYLFKAWRNKTEQTATTLSIYDDAGTTVDQKSTVSDDGTTATKAEIVSGP